MTAENNKPIANPWEPQIFTCSIKNVVEAIVKRGYSTFTMEIIDPLGNTTNNAIVEIIDGSYDLPDRFKYLDEDFI